MGDSLSERPANLFEGILQQTSSANNLRQQEFCETFIEDAKQIASNLLEHLGDDAPTVCIA